jgi:hypothetical protein
MICTATLIRDLHPIDYDHARHTKKNPAKAGFLVSAKVNFSALKSVKT